MRDITTNPEWEKLYQYEIPVLARVREDGVEVGFLFFPLILDSCFNFNLNGCLMMWLKGHSKMLKSKS